MRILVISRVDPDALESLRQEHEVTSFLDPSKEQLQGLVSDCEVVVFRSGVELSRDVLSKALNLRLLIRAGSGTDNVDLEYASSRGIGFLRIPEPSALAVSELAFALMLGLARRILWADGSLRQGAWIKGEYDGVLLNGKTLGVLGLGNIGGRVAQLGLAFGMRVIGCIDESAGTAAGDLKASGITLLKLPEVVAQADFLSVHLPLTDATRGLLGGRMLSTMKSGAFLINLARGGIVDEKALCGLLQEGRIAGAGVDVHEVEKSGHVSPLAAFPNVILTPHIGAQVGECQRRIGVRILEIVRSHVQTLRAERATR
jgi:phosphoglycerate dehydrogenase-like enzyme